MKDHINKSGKLFVKEQSPSQTHELKLKMKKINGGPQGQNTWRCLETQISTYAKYTKQSQLKWIEHPP